LKRKQPYGFSFTDGLLAKLAGVPLDALHRDVEAILRAADAVLPLARRLGVEPPRPHLAGFAYSHVSALGAEVVFAPGAEPNVHPILKSARGIDSLKEPADYLSRGVVPARLRLLEELRRRRPDATVRIGHELEGPVTTAVLLMGPEFLTLPYDDPARARRLLDFCVKSAAGFSRALRTHLGLPTGPRPVGLPDDFAGMFPPELFGELVVPSWEAIYKALGATRRELHSELLREGHLGFLAELDIAEFDPSADQYLTPELLREKCPVPFTGRIQAWEMRDMAADELVRLYRRIASCGPTAISFYMDDPGEEPKAAALLDAARKLAGE